MSIMSGRADYGDATTVGLIEDLADLLQKAEKLDSEIFRRLKPDQYNEYEACLNVDFGVAKLRNYASAWQARLDAEVAS